MREELIEKFFAKECTAEEAIQVAEYLKAYPEVLDKYLSEEEWKNIETTQMPEEFWDEIWKAIDKKKRTQLTVLWLKRSAVAACMIGLITVGYLKFSGTTKNEYTKHVTQPDIQQTVTPTPHKTIVNASAKTEEVLLPDGSVVELTKGSVIKYDTVFRSNKREIDLEGEAYFKVSKDKTKPFTVYAGGLATTALGTEFRVTTNGTKNITVQLYQGKVVVRSVNNNLKGWEKDVYLFPGQQLQYNINTAIVAVEKIKEPNDALLAKQESTVTVNKKHREESTDLVFSSSTLPDVMEKLSKYYNMKIAYDKDEIKAMNFTGTITKKDSLQIILKVIGQMNDLEISSNDSGFVVQKILQQQDEK